VSSRNPSSPTRFYIQACALTALAARTADRHQPQSRRQTGLGEDFQCTTLII
jgi:hypothetical protein